MAHIKLTLDDKTGRLNLEVEGLSVLEALGVLSIGQDQLVYLHSSDDVIDHIEETTHKQIKTKGNA